MKVFRVYLMFLLALVLLAGCVGPEAGGTADVTETADQVMEEVADDAGIDGATDTSDEAVDGNIAGEDVFSRDPGTDPGYEDILGVV